ncbi:MAG: AmmeMemoRadiSam system protein A [Terriglobia bacterium]
MLQLTEAEGEFLLRLARRGLEEAILSKTAAPEEDEIPPALQRGCGAFVTLREGSRLRGCIGRINAAAPLCSTVRECAVSAAVQDLRFRPVLPEEVARLQIEVSVLSELQPVQPEEIEIGRHGVMVSQGAHRGILLPQVAMEWNWDGIRFLEEACAKAGLPRKAWQHGARIHAFTAQVFAEHDLSETAFASPGLNRRNRQP